MSANLQGARSLAEKIRFSGDSVDKTENAKSKDVALQRAILAQRGLQISPALTPVLAETLDLVVHVVGEPACWPQLQTAKRTFSATKSRYSLGRFRMVYGKTDSWPHTPFGVGQVAVDAHLPQVPPL